MALNDPRVRQFARNAVRFAAQRVTRRVVRRRVRRNKRVIFPSVRRRFVPRNQVSAGARMTTGASLPVRTTTQTSFTGKNESVIDQEPLNFDLKGFTGETMDAVAFLVNPTNMELWPRLANRAWNFTEWDINQFVIDYTPAVGSSYNGMVQVAFNPRGTSDDPYKSPDSIMEMDAMPEHTSFSAGSPATFFVDPKNMALSGKGLFIDKGETTAEYSRYFAGVLYIRAYNCDDTKMLGRFNVRYYVSLKRPQTVMDVGNSIAVLGDDPLPGRFGFRYDETTGIGSFVGTGAGALIVRHKLTAPGGSLAFASVAGTIGTDIQWAHNVFADWQITIVIISGTSRVDFTITPTDTTVHSVRYVPGDYSLDTLPAP